MNDTNVDSRDALSRHELTHQITAPSLLSKGARACIACATAKVRCSGATPCQRCDQRNLQCAYPETGSQDVAAVEDRATNTLPALPSNMGPPPVLPGLMEPPKSYTPLPAQIAMGYDDASMNSDGWDPNMLSTSNWLDLQMDLCNTDLPFLPGNEEIWQPTLVPRQPAYQQSLSNVGPVQAISPFAVASSVSGRSGISPESAADVRTLRYTAVMCLHLY